MVALFSIGGLVVVFLLTKDATFRLTNWIGVAVGSPAPDFAYPDLAGNKVSLSDYRNNIVLLNIWATWCRPCVEEMPSMEKLYQKFKHKNFNILAVSIDAQGKAAVAPFMDRYNLSFKALLDTRGGIQQLYHTKGIPESFIIDRKGIIIEKVIGPLDWSSPKVVRFFQKQLQKSSE